MDENKNPHCPASHQFSRLAAKSDEIGASASSNFNEHWTPFSGISPHADQAAFKNLCSWNPMDLPDFVPLSEPVQVNSDTNSILTDFGVFNGSSDLSSHNNFDWNRRNSSPKFKVEDSLIGKSTDISKKRMQRCSFDSQRQSKLQQDFQRANHAVNYDDIDCSSRLHQNMHHPSFHETFVGLDTCHSQSSLSDKDTLSSAVLSDNVLSGVTPGGSIADGGLPSKISVENCSYVNSHGAPFPFSHNGTAHQFSTHTMQSSGNFPETSSFPENAEDDVTAYLKIFDPPSVVQDAASKTDRQDHSKVNTTFLSPKKHKPYTTSKQWNLRNANIVHCSDKAIPSQTQPCGPSSEASSSADLSKPSYSDIAKTHKHGPAFGAKPDHSHSEGSVKNNTFEKIFKQDEQQFKLPGKSNMLDSKSALKGSLGEGAGKPKLAASSKFGLADFTAQSGAHKMSSESSAKAVNKRGCDNSDEFNLQTDADHASSEKKVSDRVHDVKSPVQQPLFSTDPAKPPLSPKPTSSSSQQIKKDLFFDPKRIFQYENKSKVQNPAQNLTSNKTTPVLNKSANLSEVKGTPDTILNNGKPAATAASTKLSSNACPHDYISSDLRDTSKLTNKAAAPESGQGSKFNRTDELHNQTDSGLGHKFVEKTFGTHPLNTGLGCNDGSAASYDGIDVKHRHRQFWPREGRKQIVKWCSTQWSRLSHYGRICFTSLMKLLIIVLWITLCFAYVVISLLGKSWTFVKSKIFGDASKTDNKKSWSSQDFLRRNVGLEANICLPATGEEAMKRLLACKGQDPYSILGLRADSSNEDIKKFYKKQAFLVHPDKNQEPGAEEAFKILGHAFEMIGEPEKRKQFDSHILDASEIEAMREFADMLSKLQTKIQEAANMIPCDQCNGKHRRVPVERPSYSARFCERCNTHHAAKEGDVWAETTMLGFYWHYFALMDAHVFDITEWMKCHKEYFRQIKANSHTVMYKIATESNHRSRYQQGDPDLEDLINQLFKSSATANGRSPWGNSHPGSERPSAPGRTHEASTTTSAASAKKSHRKKKRR